MLALLAWLWVHVGWQDRSWEDRAGQTTPRFLFLKNVKDHTLLV